LPLCCRIPDTSGAALRIFEGLEMWDQLILCYRLLDKKQVAQELVLQRLQVRRGLQDSAQHSSSSSASSSAASASSASLCAQDRWQRRLQDTS
jgi:hypothetical protein